jgi:hypothetical protein
MKHMSVLVGVAFLQLAPAFVERGPAQEPAPVAGPRLLVAGWGLPYIAVLDGRGREEWRIPADGKQIDCWLLDEKTVLYTYNRGVREVRRDPSAKDGAAIVWDRPAAPRAESDGCQPLPSNQVLIAESHQGRLEFIELERGSLREVARVSVTNAPFLRGPHGNSRQVRKTALGSYLVGLMDQGQDGGAEFDESGALVRRFPGARYAVQERPGGGFIGAGGDSRAVIGYDAEGKETWRIKQDDIPGFPIGFCAAVHPFADGSILVANWGGHARTDGPCLGLIAPDRRSLLWSHRLAPANRVAGLQVLTPPAGQGALR